MPNCRGSFSAQTQQLVSVKGNGPQNLYPCEVCGRQVAATRNGFFEWAPESHLKLQASRPLKGRNVKVVRGKALPPSPFKKAPGKGPRKRNALKRSR